jgi:integrase
MHEPPPEGSTLLPLIRQEISAYDDSLARAGTAATHVIQDTVFLRYQRIRSEGTKEAQRRDLAIFARYLAQANVARTARQLFCDAQAWAGMTAALLEGFRLWLYYAQSPADEHARQHGYAISSVGRYLSTVRQYCRLAFQSGVIPADEWLKIQEVKAHSCADGANIDAEREEKKIVARMNSRKRYATPLDGQDLQALHTVSSRPAGGRARDQLLSQRDALLLCLLGEHGLRIGEVVALNVGSVDLRRGTLTVLRAKTHSRDVLRLLPATRAAAERYLPLISAEKAAPLFLGYRLQRISRRGLSRRVQELGKLAGIEQLSPHDLRHYWTRDWFLKEEALTTIQRYGGWTSGAMPLYYAREYGVEAAEPKALRRQSSQRPEP